MKYFYINDKKFNYIETKNSIIDFCENINLNIPYFCYHRKLSLAGNCRMCLVEIKNSLKPIVSCTLLLTSNMRVYTNSLLVKKARENVLEFLLLNHPLDCPICDQGGECDLQDQSLLFGSSKKRFYNFKRVVIDKNISPIIKMLMTRCIHCTRCVRFSYEIAGGSSLLGMYNRGVKSEIGTYISKTFTSELSGNLIDICPVGALTFKQYSFVNRNWELKNIKSIDYSDGFGLDTHVFVSNNSVIKVQPALNSSWISDKTRFSFDGMFSTERTNLIPVRLQQKKSTSYWRTLVQNLSSILYFKDHLSNYFMRFEFLIIVNNQLNLQNLNLIHLLRKKFKFIRFYKLEKALPCSDKEDSFRLNLPIKSLDFKLSQVCLLLNLNTRFEGSTLNLRLKQNFFKNNLTVISINSITNLTFPTLYLGSSLSSFNNVIEGNSIVSQVLSLSKNPFIIHNSEILKRNDNYKFFDVFQVLNFYTFAVSNSDWNGFNMLNTTLSEAGFSYFNKLQTFNFSSYKVSSLLYLINVRYNFLHRTLQRYLELKLLFFSFRLNFLLMIEQNFLLNSSYAALKFYSANFFENSADNTFLTTEGLFKSSPKIISAAAHSVSKSDQTILSFLEYHLAKLTLTSNYTPFVFFNYVFFKNLNIDLLVFPSSRITSLFWTFTKNKFCSFYTKVSKFQVKKIKYFKSKLVLWLEDFFLNSKDLYSIYSLTMLECSKSFRKLSNNFLF